MKIYDITKCLSGSVLGIGVDDRIVNILDTNDRVIECNLLDSISNSSNKGSDGKRLKKISIKKIRKIFKKKGVDYILCNVISVKKYLKNFIKDSIYINKEILYIYGVKDLDLKDELIHKYKRYNVDIEEIKDKDSYILKIDNSNSKTNLFKDVFYLIIDTLVNLLNALSDLLLN